VVWDLERINEIEFFEPGANAGPDGFRRTLVTEPDHPYVHAWWPPGHVLGWEHTFVHEVRDLLDAVAGAPRALPDFAEGLRVQRVLDAVVRSAASRRWETVAEAPAAGAERAKERTL
jgi:predicted dehydrogenase